MRKRILLGGVPFGCDNIGDEAILACAVGVFREVWPGCSITVSTHDRQGTSIKLGVEACELLGFSDVENVETSRVREILSRHDVYIWCGATGLSDYPEASTAIMRAAQAMGLTTIVWGVGMNSELNPAHYRLTRGYRYATARVLSRLAREKWDCVHQIERYRENRARRAIRRCLNRCDAVVVRDPESREELLRCGVRIDIVVGADSAILLHPANNSELSNQDLLMRLTKGTEKWIGVCISAQRPVSDSFDIVKYLDWLTCTLGANVLFVPMNPLTDSVLMSRLHLRMRQPDRAVMLEGIVEPAHVSAVLTKLDLVVSSRLHLLILASNVHIPIIGIARGSKIDNFMKPFGLVPSGVVEHLQFSRLAHETTRLLENSGEFVERSRQVRSELLSRLELGKEKLRGCMEV